VEDRLKFYDSGTLPPKNVDVMAGAVLKAEEAKNEILKKEKKKKKKAKKNKEQNGGEEMLVVEEINGHSKNGHVSNGGGVETHLEDMTIQEDVNMESDSKKKKKKKNKD